MTDLQTPDAYAAPLAPPWAWPKRELPWRACAAQRRRRLQRETVARLYVLAVLAIGAACLIVAAVEGIH